jgi:hypothetical protein
MATHVKLFINRLAVAVSVLILGSWAILIPTTSAATLSDASLLIGDPRPDATANYTFEAGNFTTTTSLQCIVLELNDTADGSGVVPTGLDSTSASFNSSTLITTGSWTLDSSTNGVLEITNGSGQTPAANGDLVFANVENGSSVATYFAIVTTYTDSSCTTTVDSATVAFTYTDGTQVELTIEPTLTFSVNGVADAETVNGSGQTTVTSTGSSIDFDTAATASANGISAHDLEVATNAAGGYVVYIRHSGQLSNGSDTIENHTGTNLTPSAFSGVGTEAWGYTTEDSTLSGTADRFTNPGNLWAGFTTNNEPVVENTTAVAGSETTRVGHQVGIANTTPAGTYQATVIYSVVSTY